MITDTKTTPSTKLRKCTKEELRIGDVKHQSYLQKLTELIGSEFSKKVDVNFQESWETTNPMGPLDDDGYYVTYFWKRGNMLLEFSFWQLSSDLFIEANSETIKRGIVGQKVLGNETVSFDLSVEQYYHPNPDLSYDELMDFVSEGGYRGNTQYLLRHFPELTDLDLQRAVDIFYGKYSPL